MTLEKFLKSIIYASLAIIPALAWYVSESSFFPFITGKGFAFRFLVEISLVAWIILAFVDSNYRPKKSLVFFSYTFFLVILCIANIFGANLYFSFFGNYERMEGWFTHLHLFLYFTILYSVYKTEKDWSAMFGWFTASAIAVSVEAVFQLFGQRGFFLTNFLGDKVTAVINSAYPTHMGNGLRLDSTLGNAAYYGIYALFFVFIASLIAFKNNKWKGTQNYMSVFWIVISTMLVLSQGMFNLFANNLQAANTSLAQTLSSIGSTMWLVGIVALIFAAKSFVSKLANGEMGSWPLAIFAALNIVLLAYTQTRGSYFGLIGGAFVTMVCIVIFGRKKYKKLAKISMFGLGLIASLVIAFIFVKDMQFVKNSVVLNRVATIKIPSLSAASETLKSGNYEELVQTFGEATIVSRILNAKMSIEGVSESPKTVLIGYGQDNYSKVFSGNFDPRMYAQEAWFDRAHNVFMDWLVAGGVLGLLAYLALYLTPIYMMWIGKGKNNIHLIEKSIITGALVAYFIHNVFVFDNLISYIIFIALLAYVASRTRDTQSVIASDISKIDKKVKAVSQNIIIASIIVASALALALFTFTVIRPLMTNLDIIKGFQKFPTSYNTLAASTTESYISFASAYNRNTFGSGEVMEQMLQKSVVLSQIDLTKLPAVEAAESKVAINDFTSFAKTNFQKMVDSEPTARNASFFGSYLRQIGDNAGSLKYLEIAYNISPTKQLIAFEYANALASNGKEAEALAVVKKAYEGDVTYKQAKDIYEALLKASQPTTTPKTNIKFK